MEVFNMFRLKKIFIFIFLLTLFNLSLASENVPYFKFKMEDGQVINKKNLKGKPAVMIFWGIYCHTCRDELPRLEKIYKKYKGKVNFIAVVVDTKDIEEVQEFKRKIKFSYPVAFINSQTDLVKFKVIGTPTTLVISPDLKIVKRYIGDVNSEELESRLKQYLKE
ncbi:MAG: TlpA family protein disulfide reductase [Persephonella sp.]|nr:MAG: TlpA family protein disulfide reductase [Persephonella sp.]